MNTTTDDRNDRNDSENRDPITGTPGSHPIGTGVGAVLGGAAAGAATGTVAGPAGTLAGAAVGAVIGGLAGKGVAEAVDPTADNAYWRDNYSKQTYVSAGDSFDDYGPAYGFGGRSFRQYPGRSFEEAERDMSSTWNTQRGSSNLSWEKAKLAARDAWNRVKEAV